MQKFEMKSDNNLKWHEKYVTKVKYAINGKIDKNRIFYKFIL